MSGTKNVELAEGKLPSSRPEAIRSLALNLFDQTQPLHELDEMSRQVLSLAAQMVERSGRLTKKRPKKAVHKLLKSEFGDDLTKEGESLLAPVIALQQGRIKTKAVLKMDLTTLQQRAVLTLAALLRIAHGLDASESQSTSIQRVDLSGNEMKIQVSGPQAEQDAISAEHEARLWEKIGYPPVIVQKLEPAAVAPPVQVVEMERTPILPDDSLAEAGRKVFYQQLLAVMANEAGTRLGEDIEALHDMRVATRRLRAAFEVFGDGFERKALKSHLSGLRATGRALGVVRDQDVFMEKVNHYIQLQAESQGHGLDPLLAAWQSAREQARAAMLTHLDSKEYQAFKESFLAFVTTPGAGALPEPKSCPQPRRVCELAPALIYERLAAVRAYDGVIGTAPVETLHALRIEFKKLRYTVEYFRDVLGPEAPELIDLFKDMQDHLGDLNDAQVAIQILDEFLKSELKSHRTPDILDEETQAVHAYQAYRQAERDRLLETFPEAWARFNNPEFRQKIARVVSVL